MYVRIAKYSFNTDGISDVYGLIFLNYGSVLTPFLPGLNIPITAARHCALFRMTSPILLLKTPGIEIGLNRFAKAQHGAIIPHFFWPTNFIHGANCSKKRHF